MDLINKCYFSRWSLRKDSADGIRVEFYRVLLRSSKRRRFDKLERRRGVHSIVSADEVFSRYFVEEVQQLVTHAVSLFDLQDVCMVIGSLATLDLPMVVDLIGIFELKGSYCMLTMTDGSCSYQ
ncbi:hypothetical protein F511_23192 [Dorcoceras hygrometricum]|uniref:Uncharacterized protein n=1 Tax=Dorcoceras hygrometricum TaxID=472368 RepID=A0A2Z7API8_9LAMI|nr:hypothetical protein F511_23192 [Dorcoceras hygrometricum]